jgi:hypothetical protein
MSVSINEVIETLKKLKAPVDLLIKAETELENIEQEKKEDKQAADPKAKNKFVTILLDPEKKLAGLGDFTSLVVQIPEDHDDALTINKIVQSVYDQNAASKRKTKAINTLGEAASAVKRKFLKTNDVLIKTKEPVRVLVSDNIIPKS